MSVKLEFYSVDKLKKQIAEVIGKHLNLNDYKMFFFGSRVNGKASERSDIDVGIKGENEIPFKMMAEIKNEISDLPILYKIDVVDFMALSKDFSCVAEKDVEPIR